MSEFTSGLPIQRSTLSAFSVLGQFNYFASLRSAGVKIGTSRFWYVLGTVASLLQMRTAQAEDSITVKAQSWQEDNQRIRVDSQYALIEVSPTLESRLKIMGLVDTISGATPTGAQPENPGDTLPLASTEDVRRAWDANFAYQFKRVNVAVSYGVSIESDYLSKGYSLNTITDFNQKNTLLLLGWGHVDDRLNADNWANDRKKTGDDFIVGVTQLLSPQTFVTANVSYGRATGFLTDPYKLVSTFNFDQNGGFYDKILENRPSEKDKVSLYLGANHYFEKLAGALDGSYRFYHDSFGVSSHTVELTWVQKLGAHFRLEPMVRYYRQTAADFYYVDVDQAGFGLLPFESNGSSPFYSSDYRLSEMETYNFGLKLSWILNDHLTFDVAYERYYMHGLDGATPSEAYVDASTFTVGMKLAW